jgi:uncharacterized protein
VTVSGLRRGRGGAIAGVLLAVVSVALVALLAPSTGALEVPFLAGRVNDLAGALSPAARERIEAHLRDLESRTGAQVAVLVIPSLEGESLEPFSVRVAQTWKLGRKGVDDGVLFLVAKNDRKMRIEVGYGLESTLTDARSRAILDERVRPRFRANDFDGGIGAGVDAIAALIEGKPLARSTAARPRGRRGSDLLPRLFTAVIFTAVIGVHSLVAILTPHAMGWFLYVFLMPFYAMFPSFIFPPYGGIVACGAWILLFPILRHRLKPWSKEFKARHPTLVGFSGGGGRSSSGGGWSSGGSGGFSGGGGSFGGGGASSSW